MILTYIYLKSLFLLFYCKKTERDNFTTKTKKTSNGNRLNIIPHAEQQLSCIKIRKKKREYFFLLLSSIVKAQKPQRINSFLSRVEFHQIEIDEKSVF